MKMLCFGRRIATADHQVRATLLSSEAAYNRRRCPAQRRARSLGPVIAPMTVAKNLGAYDSGETHDWA
jgi:hypothetical protein